MGLKRTGRKQLASRMFYDARRKKKRNKENRGQLEEESRRENIERREIRREEDAAENIYFFTVSFTPSAMEARATFSGKGQQWEPPMNST